MWEAGISGWRADWRSGSDQVARHTDALVSLVGCKLTGAWSIWIGADDWFADMPVVLQFDGSTQLEVCWQKFDDLSISWNTIDVTVAPKAWVEDISWRPWDHTAFTLNEGQVVTSVAATEFVFKASDVDHPHREPQSATFTGGLWFGTTGPGLHIFNALDENGLNTAYEPDTLKPLLWGSSKSGRTDPSSSATNALAPHRGAPSAEVVVEAVTNASRDAVLTAA